MNRVNEERKYWNDANGMKVIKTYKGDVDSNWTWIKAVKQ